MKINKKTNKQKKIIKALSKYIPPVLTCLVFTLYLVLMATTYFLPLLSTSIDFEMKILSELKEFKNYYNHAYKIIKGKNVIYIELGFFIFTYLMALISFLRTSLTNPGKIPDTESWKINVNSDVPEEERSQLFYEEIDKREEELLSNKNRLMVEMPREAKSLGYKMQVTISERKSDEALRYCITCLKFKPDRAHHCNYCEECILKCDHHCPWVGNCIGFYNYKFFICLINYSWVCCGFFVFIYYDVIRFLVLNEKVRRLI